MNRRVLTLTFALLWGVLALGLASWGTAATAASSAVTNLRINEFMALNTAVITDPVTGSFADWIEIYNMGGTDVDLNGLYITDNPAQLTKHQFTQTLIVPAGGYVLLWAINPLPPDAPANYVGFALGTSGESVVLVDTNGTTILDTYTFGPQAANVSLARMPDGTGPFVATSFPTPGQSNAASPPAYSLRINEFMATNSSTITDPVNGSFADWIEIHNMGTTAVDLQGLYLTDDPNNLTKHQMASSLVIPAGGYLLLWAINAPPAGPQYVQFALSGSGESILIVDTNGTSIIDSFTFGAQTADVSMSRVPNGLGNFVFTPLATPGQPNITPPTISNVGRSVPFPTASDVVQVTARIVDDVAVESATLHYSANGAAYETVPMTHQGSNNYSANIPAFGNGTVISYYLSATDGVPVTTVSPAGAPATTYGYVVGYTRPTLIVNEFTARPTPLESPAVPGTYPDWIEIYNYGTSAVSLDGLFLTDNLDNPRLYAIPTGLSVPANGYIVFYADNNSMAGPLHTNFALGANEAVGLYGANGFDTIDAFSYTGYTAAFDNITRGRLPDGSAGIVQLPTMTPGRSNQLLYQVSHAPAIPPAGQVGVVTAVISDGMGTVDTATLLYTVDNGPILPVPMNKTGNTFTAPIPPQAAGAVVRYHIEASYTNPVNFTSVGLLGEYGYVSGYQPPQLYINEFMARNTATLSNTLGSFPDWIEIYNPTAAPISLAGLYLTDNRNNPTKFAIDASLSVPAHGFILFYAENVPGPISNTAEALYYTGFSLSQAGEDVALYGAEGFVLIDGVFDYDPQGENHSYGRTTDGNPVFQTFILNTPEYPSPNAPNDRRAPVITNVGHTPSYPNSTQSVTITADVTDNGVVDTVTLYYREQGVGVFTATAMSLASGDTYTAAVAPYPDGTVIEYYVEAEDGNSNLATAPANAPTTVYSYTVYDDPPPTITNVAHTPLVPTSQDPVTVRADITTTLALSETVVLYRLNGAGPFTSVAMGLSSGDEYTAVIPAQADGTLVEYYVRAVDTDGGVAMSPVNAPITLYSYTVTDPIVPPPPTIDNVLFAPTAPLPSQVVAVTAEISSTVGLSQTHLFYRAQGEPTFSQVGLQLVSGQTFSGTIPPFAANTVVEFYLLATDVLDQSTAAPAGAPTAVYTYTVADDPVIPVPPVIANPTLAPTAPISGQVATVQAVVTDDGALVEVLLWYRLNGGAYVSVTMAVVEGDVYQAQIPAQVEGVVVEYYLSAEDDDGLLTTNPAELNLPYSYTVGAEPVVSYAIYLPLITR